MSEKEKDILEDLKKVLHEAQTPEEVVPSIPKGEGAGLQTGPALDRLHGLSANQNVWIEVSQDGMEAKLFAVSGNPDRLDEVFLKRLLLFRGIRFGVIAQHLELALQKIQQGMEIQGLLIAAGKKPEHGQDAILNLYFEKSALLKRVVDPLQKSMDYRSVNRINMVRSGQVLCEKVETRKFVDGTNVRGETVLAKRGRDLPVFCGKNTKAGENGEIYACIDGRPEIDESGRISVYPVYTVKGDLDLSVGNIEFKGDVEILGNVIGGYSILAGGDVYIEGSVEQNRIEAGGSLVIRGSVTGGEKGFCKSGQNMTLSHVNTGNFEVGGDLFVNKEIINANVLVRKNLIMTGRRGSVLGGEYLVGGIMETFHLGSGLGVRTDIFMGVFEMSRRELKAVQSKIQEFRDILVQLNQNIARFREEEKKAGNEKNPRHREVILGKLENSILVTEKEIFEREKREKELQLQMEVYHSAFLRVGGELNSGVNIHFGKLEWKVNKLYSAVEIYEDPKERKLKRRVWVRKKEKV